jgi:thioredoxin 1
MPVPTHDATEATFDELVLSPKDELVVVDFWGEGCPNCAFFESHRPKLLERLDGRPLRVVRVNAYAEEGLARRFGLFGIPAFLLFRNGKLLGRMSEYKGPDFWMAVVTERLSG